MFFNISKIFWFQRLYEMKKEISKAKDNYQKYSDGIKKKKRQLIQNTQLEIKKINLIKWRMVNSASSK